MAVVFVARHSQTQRVLMNITIPLIERQDFPAPFVNNFSLGEQNLTYTRLCTMWTSDIPLLVHRHVFYYGMLIK